MNTRISQDARDHLSHSTQRCCRLVREGDRFRATLATAPITSLSSTQVRVRVVAASLNYRDLLVIHGQYGGVEEGLIPLSDVAGTIESVGAKVTKWRAGDRVMPIFMSDWITGSYKLEYAASALGGESPGVLSETVDMPEDAVVRIPDHLTFEEAATLPCAAVAVWHGLFARGESVKHNDTVLVQGTGGAALFGLQFALAVGARVIVTSSSDEKLERARTLGAWATINYKTHPQWDEEVLRLTAGQGVDHILELGGPDTYERSINSVACGGKIVQIGVLTGFGPQPNLLRLQRVNADIIGIMVGSAEHFMALNEFVTKYKIKPVIDRVFAFEKIQAAFDYLASSRHFGKIVVRLVA